MNGVLDLLGRAARSTLIRLAITAAILAYLATRIDMGDAARAMAAISRPHLAAVLLLIAVDRAVMILRWVLLLRASGIAISAGDAARLFLVSSFVGSFLPAGIGADAARAIRELPPMAGVPIIAMTSADFDRERDRRLITGMDDHVGKPVDFDVLCATVLHWLRKKSAVR